jgi:hypothetical protein
MFCNPWENMIMLKKNSILAFALVAAAACGSTPGPDAITVPNNISGSACLVCHGSTDPNSAIPNPLLTNGTGTYGKHLRHVGSLGFTCTTCHYQYPLDINSLSTPSTHMNGSVDGFSKTGNRIVFFGASNPTGSFHNATAGGAATRNGSCWNMSCHNTNVNWYGPSSWPSSTSNNPPDTTVTPTDCRVCHGLAVGTRRQVLATGSAAGAGGDFKQLSHHVITYATPTTETISVPNDCYVCHNMSSHMSGSVRLANKTDGSVVAYDPSTPSSLEPFCLSCHNTNGVTTDATGTKPFSDGNVLGAGLNVMGNKIATAWNSANPTHRNNGLTCLGTGLNNTGCHGNSATGTINGHGSASRGLLASNLTATIDPNAAYSYSNYQLCLDCHANNQFTAAYILGYKLGGLYDRLPTIDVERINLVTAGSPTIQSGFRKRSILSALTYSTSYPSYWSRTWQQYAREDWGWGTNGTDGTTYVPLHNMHLFGNQPDIGVNNGIQWFTWKYRGQNGQIGRITCISCHNVHGTANNVRNTFDELQLTRGIGLATGNGTNDLYTTMPHAAKAVMTNSPTNCLVACHASLSNAGADLYYWQSPSEP